MRCFVYANLTANIAIRLGTPARGGCGSAVLLFLRDGNARRGSFEGLQTLLPGGIAAVAVVDLFDVAVKLAEGEKGAAFFGTAGVAAFAQAFIVIRG